MKIKIIPTGTAPDYYSFSGEKVIAHSGSVEDAYDLAGFPEGGRFQGTEDEVVTRAVRGVRRENGELYVTLTQAVGPGHWVESEWMGPGEYEPDGVHVSLTDEPYHGQAWAKTREGQTLVEGQ